MKICFFLQRRFAYIGHALACRLKETEPSMEFCGVVQTRPSLRYLQSQHDLTYTSLLLEGDLHHKIKGERIDSKYLAMLEREYGLPTLWPYLYVDRIVMNGQLKREYPYNRPTLSRDDMLRLLQVSARGVIAFLDREKPDAVVFSVIGSVAGMLLYYMAKKRGIKVIYIEVARLGERVALSNDYRNFSWVLERFKQFSQEAPPAALMQGAERILKEFRECPAPYAEISSPTYNNQVYRSSHLHFLLPMRLLRSLAWHARMLLQDLGKIGGGDYDDILIWWKVWDKAKRKLRGLRGYNDLWSPIRPAERFAYYPLHSEPEIATLLLAPYYTNQTEVIRAAARSLPIDMYLYVKEHPEMVSYRPRAYYRELLKIPNVRLIDPRISNYELLRETKLVVTITGTGGWEGILYGKPAITFGDVFYNDLSATKRCRTFEELPFQIKTQLERGPLDETELLHYLAALLEDSIESNYIDLWNSGLVGQGLERDSGIANLAQLLGEKLHAA